MRAKGDRDMSQVGTGGEVEIVEMGLLMCPCGDQYLHHIGVALVGAFNPDPDSPARLEQAIRVKFWCECCDNRPTLLIKQHKGCTYLEWEP